jgi:hypothetical protein
MTTDLTTRGAEAPATPNGSAETSTETSAGATSALLACGVAAGPLFVGAALIQALTRTGFDPREHPVSLLSLGSLGWIQIINFVVAGLLFVACAAGMRRILHPGRAGTWGPRLIGTFGVSLIAGGVFVADPALGFPPGTPAGTPDQLSWHGMLHAIAPAAGFLALTLACLVFARRSAALNQRAWAAYSVATGVAVQVLGGWTSMSGDYLPLGAAIVLGFGWASAQAARLRPGSSAR